jgi:hypothetical protein
VITLADDPAEVDAWDLPGLLPGTIFTAGTPRMLTAGYIC